MMTFAIKEGTLLRLKKTWAKVPGRTEGDVLMVLSLSFPYGRSNRGQTRRLTCLNKKGHVVDFMLTTGTGLIEDHKSAFDRFNFYFEVIEPCTSI
jgi:hypothetical protein